MQITLKATPLQLAAVERLLTAGPFFETLTVEEKEAVAVFLTKAREAKKVYDEEQAKATSRDPKCPKCDIRILGGSPWDDKKCDGCTSDPRSPMSEVKGYKSWHCAQKGHLFRLPEKTKEIECPVCIRDPKRRLPPSTKPREPGAR